ncbi:MAG: toxin-antitoxin system HicB family antitoxin [Clostridia bacterium]|nr:toxin-antitoxin system HicB family antitoxin [Deltaproteobacteria bacterium]
MNSKVERYTYRVMWSEEDGEYVGLCAEFPSLSHLDESSDGAWNGIHRLAADVFEEMVGAGQQPPEPIATKRYSGEFMARVSPDLHRRLALEAAEAGESMNKIVIEKLARQ